MVAEETTEQGVSLPGTPSTNAGGNIVFQVVWSSIQRPSRRHLDCIDVGCDRYIKTCRKWKRGFLLDHVSLRMDPASLGNGMAALFQCSILMFVLAGGNTPMYLYQCS